MVGSLFNGGALNTQAPGATPSGLNRMQIGAYNGHVMSGGIESIDYYPQRLPNATLQQLTTA